MVDVVTKLVEGRVPAPSVTKKQPAAAAQAPAPKTASSTPTSAKADQAGCTCPTGAIRRHAPPGPPKSLYHPPPDCHFPGGQLYNGGKETIHWVNLAGQTITIPPNYGLWMENGVLKVAPKDLHPADEKPKTGNDGYGCTSTMVHKDTEALPGVSLSTGWVSLKCEMGRDRFEHELHSRCE